MDGSVWFPLRRFKVNNPSVILTRKDKVTTLIQIISGLPQGTLVTWWDLMDWSKSDKTEVTGMLQTVKSKLRSDHGVFLDSAHGQGYTLCPLPDQTRLINESLLKIYKHGCRVGSTVRHIRVHDLSDPSEKMRVMAAMAEIAQDTFFMEKGAMTLAEKEKAHKRSLVKPPQNA
jgi:hypothetical protein